MDQQGPEHATSLRSNLDPPGQRRQDASGNPVVAAAARALTGLKACHEHVVYEDIDKEC